MEVLRFFQTLNLQGKTSGHGFYRSLVYLTDSTGLHPPPVCYQYCPYIELTFNLPP